MICSAGKKNGHLSLFLNTQRLEGPGGFRSNNSSHPAPSPHVRRPFCRWPESWGPERGPLVLIGGGKGLVVGGGVVGLTFKNRGHFWVLGVYIYNIYKYP